MSTPTPAPGSILWRDLTVADVEPVKRFYEGVAGWRLTEHPMGGYSDYNVYPGGSEECIAGICHARGANANIPPQWLMYISVPDVNAAAKKAVELGGRVIDGPRSMGNHTFCVVKDPAGAVVALIAG